MAESTPESFQLRIKLRQEGHMNVWPEQYKVDLGYPAGEIRDFCVEDTDWQKVRRSMKGQPTHTKLLILKTYWEKNQNIGLEMLTANRPNAKMLVAELNRATEVQVGNYLGALRRGGQLDNDNQVRKYL